MTCALLPPRLLAAGSRLLRTIADAAAAVAVVIATASPACAQCVLRVGWTAYGVYTFADDQGQARGIDIDLISAVAHDIGCATSFRELPWTRVLLELQSGELDATTSASRTREREAFALFSRPYRQAETAIFVRQSDVQLFPMRSLADVPTVRMRLGYVIGYYYGPTFAALLQDPAFAASTDGTADFEVNIVKLLHDRIDGILVDDWGVMIGWAKKLGVSGQVERHPLRLFSDQLHFMFSRRTVAAGQLAEIDSALQRMRADGRLQAIFDRHLK